jgi:hypothetical protein
VSARETSEIRARAAHSLSLETSESECAGALQRMSLARSLAHSLTPLYLSLFSSSLSPLYLSLLVRRER